MRGREVEMKRELVFGRRADIVICLVVRARCQRGMRFGGMAGCVMRRALGARYDNGDDQRVKCSRDGERKDRKVD